MKTNVILNSSDRNLFGVIIRQQTKDGSMLSISDLQNAYNTARYQYGWSEKNINKVTRTKDFQERCYYLLNERGIVKGTISTFTQMIEKEGIVKVLKGLNVWKTKRGKNDKGTYADPYLWVLIAMELNPMIYAKVVIWLTDTLVFNRMLAGDNFKPMNRAISTIINKPNYPEYSKAINNKVFGYHKSGMRNKGTQKQLKSIADIENFITQSIDMGIVKKEEHIFRVINSYNINNIQKKFAK